eukprot:6350-Heterococcus_DN1.PRE.3
MKLLLAKGVSAVALDAQGRSALQLACLYDDPSKLSTVSTLLSSGGWLPDLGFDCLLNSCIAGDPACFELLLEHASNTSSSSGSSSNSSSSAISDLVSGTTAGSDYTLLHAAAAWGRLQCVGILLRYGLDASGLSATGKTPAALAASGSDRLPEQLRREGFERPARSKRQKVVLLLLRSGAAVETDMMCYDCYSKAVQQCMQEQQQQLVAQAQALTLLADKAYRSCRVTVTVSSSSSSSSNDDTVTQQQGLTGAVDATAKQHIVSVQLVHASTGE